MLVLNWTRSSPFPKWSFEAKIVTLLSFCDEMRMIIPLFMYFLFCNPYCYKKKHILRRTNVIWMQWTQKLYFLHMKDAKLPIIIFLGHRGVWDNVKLDCGFCTFFARSGNLKSLYWKCIAQKNKWAEVLVRFIVFSKYMYM